MFTVSGPIRKQALGDRGARGQLQHGLMSVVWPLEPKHGTRESLGPLSWDIAYWLLGEQCARLRERHEPRCGLVASGDLGWALDGGRHLKLAFQVSGTRV